MHKPIFKKILKILSKIVENEVILIKIKVIHKSTVNNNDNNF
jgi:hypothetical protein